MGLGHGFGQKLFFLILKSLPVAVDWWQSVVFDDLSDTLTSVLMACSC